MDWATSAYLFFTNLHAFLLLSQMFANLMGASTSTSPSQIISFELTQTFLKNIFLLWYHHTQNKRQLIVLSFLVRYGSIETLQQKNNWWIQLHRNQVAMLLCAT